VNEHRGSRLCFLATESNGEPHLSLMNFTYVQKGESLILCTKKNTKKYGHIMKNHKVNFIDRISPHLLILQNNKNKLFLFYYRLQS
jgi:uncharacterized pyridoxamine 5'-phosphate oxidase family protein